MTEARTTITTRQQATEILTREAKSLVGILFLAEEVPSAVSSAVRDLMDNGFVYFGNLSLTLSRRGADQERSRNIRNMSAAAFERFAVGL